jgi:hypothetical protein
MLKFATASMRFGMAVGAGLWSLILVIAVSPASADQSSTSQLLIREKLVQKVTVILMPDPIEMLYKFKEQNLVQMGCTYVTEDKRAINALVELLADSDMTPNTKSEYVEDNLHQGVYLDFSDGTTKKYLFNLAPTGERVDGVSVESWSKDVIHFTAHPVAKSLREWSSTAGKNTKHDSLDILRANCDKN